MTKPAIIRVHSSKRFEIADITEAVARAIADSGVGEGICVLQSLHTTAALTINESADLDVRRDMEKQLSLIVPRDPSFLHAEGNSDAHIKTSLFGPSLSLAVSSGRPVLGTWQAIYSQEGRIPRSSLRIRDVGAGIRSLIQSNPLQNERYLAARCEVVHFCEFDGPRERSVLVKCIEG